MLLSEYRKMKEELKPLELDDCVGVLLKALPYTSITRYFDIEEEKWEMIRYKTRGDVVKDLIKRLELALRGHTIMRGSTIMPENGFERENYRTREVVVLFYFLYPKEYNEIKKKIRSRLSGTRVRGLLSIKSILEQNREREEARASELV